MNLRKYQYIRFFRERYIQYCYLAVILHIVGTL